MTFPESDNGDNHLASRLTLLLLSFFIRSFLLDDADLTDKVWSLDTGVAIASGDDLNTYLTNGNYYSRTNAISATLSNTPTAKAFNLKVFDPTVVGGYKIQLLITYQADLYIRAYNQSSGNFYPDWQSIPTTAVDLTSLKLEPEPM